MEFFLGFKPFSVFYNVLWNACCELWVLAVVTMKNRHLGCNAKPVDVQNFRGSYHIFWVPQEINQCFTGTCCLMITVVSTLGVGKLYTDKKLKNVLLMMPELVHHILLVMML
jgi:hypothetical protein